jgi:chromosome segregation ATPase
MDTRKQANALNIEDELKKLREKSDRGELMELKRGPFGGYSNKAVALYVARLKEQLQTSERTFKSHISELTAEKDGLKAERDALQSKLAAYENGAKAKPAVEVPHAVDDELRLAEQLRAGLQQEKDALQRQFAEQAGDYGLKAQEYVMRISELEDRLAEDQGLADEYERQLDDLEKKFERSTEEGRKYQSQLSETRQENCKLILQTETLSREIEGLSAQLEMAKRNILGLISDKEELESINVQLRESLNSLVVKADAMIRENNLLNTQLETGRAKVQQYQAMHEKLSDMLMKVRTAGQMLDEKVVEMDRALSFGDGQIAGPRASATRPASKAELLDFSPAESTALQDVASELASIQLAMSQMQPPIPFSGDTGLYSPGEQEDEKYSPVKIAVNGR